MAIDDPNDRHAGATPPPGDASNPMPADATDADATDEDAASAETDAPAHPAHEGAQHDHAEPGHGDHPEPATSGSAEPPVPGVPVALGEAGSEDNKKWYVVKVQSGREETIREAIERRVKIEGLQDFFGKIIVPVERVTEMSRGKRVVKERKLYPGYLMVNLEFNDRMLYLFRETSGVGDFVGGSFNKPPPPMSSKEVERLEKSQQSIEERAPEPGKAPFEKGDHVKVKDGTFAGMEGSVKDILEHKGAVVVELTIFGRPVPVELEYWQVDEA